MRPIMLLLALTFTFQTPLSYEWEETGLTVEYPASWETPAPTLIDGNPSLQIAEVLADTAINVRPPGIPTIILTVRPASDNQVDDLRFDLIDIGIDQLGDPAQVDFLDSTAQRITGTNSDGALFGIAQVAALNSDEVLVVLGRSVGAQEAEFTALFETVTASIQGGNTTGTRIAQTYGILWQTQRSIDDAEDAFLNLTGLASGPDEQLYTFEADLGVVQIDAQTGGVASITPNVNISAASDLAVAADGTVYVADLNCNCIFTLRPDKTWLDMPFGEGIEMDEGTGLITGFGPDSPTQLVIGDDDALYVSNTESDGSISLRVFEDGVLTREIPLPEDFESQPLLAVAQDGRVLALNILGQLVEIGADGVSQLADLGPMPGTLSGFALTADGNIVIAMGEDGIVMLAPNGDLLNPLAQIVEAFPTPGEAVAPSAAAVSTEGTIYFVDSDGFFGAITALSTSVPANRLGAEALIPGLAVQGLLSVDSPNQRWTYEGDAGSTITITAQDNAAGTMNLALRLLAPDGSEIAYNDDHSSLDLFNPTDAQIAGFNLPESGLFTVVVESVEGEGTYSLGLSLTRMINAGTAETGELSAVFPAQTWHFNGSAGQSVTITLTPISTTLDSILRVYDPDGFLLAENDDAEDPALGVGSHLSITLPADGLYVVEAARFDGGGQYELIIE